MGGQRFEVLLLDAASGAMIRRDWSKADLLKSVAWLKRMNARGSEVYVRPAGEHGLVLLVALQGKNLAAMRRKGFEPAITVETTIGEFEAWVKLSDRAILEPVRGLATAGMIQAFGAGSKLVSGSEFGRLAGFTMNSSHQDIAEKKKYVLVHDGARTVASAAATYVDLHRTNFDGAATR